FGGKPSSARRTLRRAIKADPKNAAAYRVLVLVYIKMKKKSQAKRTLRTFKRLKPNSPFVPMLTKQVNAL
ncbi:MAG TPA: hypothetical protein DCE42_01095, partial [Myxococcales bacterium]|nr:hypothetical protein [Myxococcales bacterium]